MPPKRKKRSTNDVLNAALDAGTAIQKQDRKAEKDASKVLKQVARLPLVKILDRHENTRHLNAQHVIDLCESIQVLGLLEPLIVDLKGRMLAGGHRRAAIELLKAENREQYNLHFPEDMIPVRVYEIDADENPEIALEIEISENEKRRDYTPTEVQNIANRLIQSGYSDVKGRPAKGQKPLRPAIELIIGKSLRTVRRYLNNSVTESVTPVRLSEDEQLSLSMKAVKRLKTELLRWEKSDFDENPLGKTLRKDISRLIEKTEKIIDKHSQ